MAEDDFGAGYDAVAQVEDPANPGTWFDIDGQDGASLDRSYETRDNTHKKPAGVGGAPTKQEAPVSQNYTLSITGKTNFSDPGFLAIDGAVSTTGTRKFRFIKNITSAEGVDPKTFAYDVFTAYPSMSQEFPTGDGVSYSINFLVQGEIAPFDAAL